MQLIYQKPRIMQPQGCGHSFSNGYDHRYQQCFLLE